MATHMQAETKVVNGFFIHLVVYCLVVVALGVMNYQRNPDNLWFLWVVGGWGVGVALHAATVFMRPEKRQQMVERTEHRMERREARH